MAFWKLGCGRKAFRTLPQKPLMTFQILLKKSIVHNSFSITFLIILKHDLKMLKYGDMVVTVVYAINWTFNDDPKTPQTFRGNQKDHLITIGQLLEHFSQN